MRKALLFAFAFCLALFALPGKAHATFRDVADSFPAAQDLGEYGAPIYGNQLPDGMYKIAARTSSRMCIMYTNPADAEARDSKEQAIVSVEGGSMTVLFYISKAYTHLYWGTQDEAAAATNEDGTDASAYIVGDPDEGYVPHLFALPISALNVPMTISTFSGGDRGVQSGRWYTRQVVFAMSEAELQEATAGAQEPEQSAEDGQAAAAVEGMIAALPEAEAATLADESATAEARTAFDALTDDQKTLVSNEAKLQAVEARLAELRQAADAEAAALAADSAGDGDGGASEEPQPEETQEPDPEPEPEPAAEPEPVPPAVNATRGVPMHIAGMEALPDVKAPEVEPAEDPQPEVPIVPLVLASALVLALTAGIAARTALFMRALDLPDPREGKESTRCS